MSQEDTKIFLEGGFKKTHKKQEKEDKQKKKHKKAKQKIKTLPPFITVPLHQTNYLQKSVVQLRCLNRRSRRVLPSGQCG